MSQQELRLCNSLSKGTRIVLCYRWMNQLRMFEFDYALDTSNQMVKRKVEEGKEIKACERFLIGPRTQAFASSQWMKGFLLWRHWWISSGHIAFKVDRPLWEFLHWTCCLKGQCRWRHLGSFASPSHDLWRLLLLQIGNIFLYLTSTYCITNFPAARN